MLIPRIFLGNSREVLRRVDQLVDRFVGGTSLEQLFPSSEMVGTDEFPDALIWMNSIKPMRPASGCDFRVVRFYEALRKHTFQGGDAHRITAVRFLEQSAWGTAVLNSGQGAYWYRGIRYAGIKPCRIGVVSLLRATARHWDELLSTGPRFTSGSEGRLFPSVLTSSFAGPIKELGVPLELRSVGPSGIWTNVEAYEDPRAALERGNIIERLERDDAFWAAFESGTA